MMREIAGEKWKSALDAGTFRGRHVVRDMLRPNSGSIINTS